MRNMMVVEWNPGPRIRFRQVKMWAIIWAMYYLYFEQLVILISVIWSFLSNRIRLDRPTRYFTPINGWWGFLSCPSKRVHHHAMKLLQLSITFVDLPSRISNCRHPNSSFHPMHQTNLEYVKDICQSFQSNWISWNSFPRDILYFILFHMTRYTSLQSGSNWKLIELRFATWKHIFVRRKIPPFMKGFVIALR